MLNEVKRMQKLAGILKESGLGAAYAERELDGDASRQMHEEVDFLDLKTGQDVFVKSKKAYGVISDLDSPSSPDTGEDPHVIVKLRNGEEIDVRVTDLEVDESDDSGNGDHYGDEEDDKSYYQSRGWKSSMEEDQDPQAKMNKLVGLEEASESDFEKFMRAMGDLYGLSNSGFIKPEEWKQIFPVYTTIYSRVQDMGVEHFKNDK